MEIEIMQHREDKMIDHYEMDIDGGAIVVIKNGELIIIPISEIAGVRSKHPFFEISEKEMEIQRNFVCEIAKKLEIK